MKCKARNGVLSLLMLLGATVALNADSKLLIDDFEGGLRAAWKVKEFKGSTEYTVVQDGGGHVLKATSSASASGLICETDYDPATYPILTWRWKVGNVIQKGDESRKGGDDYSARVYVVFPHWFFPKTRSINYIWANKLSKGRHMPNPFASNAVMVAVQSGQAEVGKWLIERRNVVEDYRALFGGDPPRVATIALMTDTDNTGESAVAWYDDIQVQVE